MFFFFNKYPTKKTSEKTKCHGDFKKKCKFKVHVAKALSKNYPKDYSRCLEGIEKLDSQRQNYNLMREWDYTLFSLDHMQVQYYCHNLRFLQFGIKCLTFLSFPEVTDTEFGHGKSNVIGICCYFIICHKVLFGRR